MRGELLQLAFETGQAIPGTPAVDLELRLAGSPSAAAAGESRQRDLGALREPRQQVLELRQLHLELASRVVACCAKMSRMSCVRSMREGELADQTANTPGNHWLTPTEVGVWLFHTQQSASGFTVKEIPFNPILTLAWADRGVRPRRAHLAPAHPPAITASSRRARPGRTQRPLVRAAATRVGALGAALPGSWSSGREATPLLRARVHHRHRRGVATCDNAPAFCL